MVFLGETDRFKHNTLHELVIDGVALLLIYQNDRFYLIENKCGHFGLPLSQGEVKGEEIICPHHGISFSLLSGEVVNRPYENCDMIRVFNVVEQNSGLYLGQPVN